MVTFSGGSQCPFPFSSAFATRREAATENIEQRYSLIYDYFLGVEVFDYLVAWLDYRSLNNYTFWHDYVLMRHALSEEAGALQFTEAEQHKLKSISASRTEEKRRTVRAAILLDSLSGQSDESIARHHQVSRGTVALCIQKFLEFGLDAALGE